MGDGAALDVVKESDDRFEAFDAEWELSGSATVLDSDKSLGTTMGVAKAPLSVTSTCLEET